MIINHLLLIIDRFWSSGYQAVIDYDFKPIAHHSMLLLPYKTDAS